MVFQIFGCGIKWFPKLLPSPHLSDFYNIFKNKERKGTETREEEKMFLTNLKHYSNLGGECKNSKEGQILDIPHPPRFRKCPCKQCNFSGYTICCKNYVINQTSLVKVSFYYSVQSIVYIYIVYRTMNGSKDTCFLSDKHWKYRVLTC